MSINLCGCKRQQKIKQYCPKHNTNLLSHFCANNSCLELLCQQCLKQHQQNHKKGGLLPQKLVNLVEVEEYYDKITAKELQYEQSKKQQGNTQQKIIDPCQIICEYVDQYFYGSVENKISNLKARKDILTNPSPKAFIDVVEKTSHYKLERNFKQKYFALLDQIFEKTAQS